MTVRDCGMVFKMGQTLYYRLLPWLCPWHWSCLWFWPWFWSGPVLIRY